MRQDGRPPGILADSEIARLAAVCGSHDHAGIAAHTRQVVPRRRIQKGRGACENEKGPMAYGRRLVKFRA